MYCPDEDKLLVNDQQISQRLLSDIHDIKAELNDIRDNMVSQRTMGVYKWILGGVCASLAAGFWWAMGTQMSRFTVTDGDRLTVKVESLADDLNGHLINHPHAKIYNQLAEINAEMRNMSRQIGRIEKDMLNHKHDMYPEP